MKSKFLESTDHLKNTFSLKLKTVPVTRTFGHDFAKTYLKDGAIFVIVRRVNFKKFVETKLAVFFVLALLFHPDFFMYSEHAILFL